jgi:hypothetical protein
MFVVLDVAPADAVKARKTRSGKCRVEIAEEQLASLTEEQLVVFAECAGQEDNPVNAPRGSTSRYGNPAEPTWGAVVSVLDAILADRAAKAEQKRLRQAEITAKTREVLAQRRLLTQRVNEWDKQRKVSYQYDTLKPAWAHYAHDDARDPAVVESPEAQAWIAELDQQNVEARDRAIAEALARQAQEAKCRAEKEAQEAEEQARKQAQEAQYSAAVAALVRQVGSPVDVDRLEAGVLPQEEIDRLVHDHVFAPLNEFPRYEKLTARDVEHDENCCADDASYDVDDAGELTADEWTRLKAIRAAMPAATVTPRLHSGECRYCEGGAERLSAKVLANWHGRDLTREYAL